MVPITTSCNQVGICNLGKEGRWAISESKIKTAPLPAKVGDERKEIQFHKQKKKARMYERHP